MEVLQEIPQFIPKKPQKAYRQRNRSYMPDVSNLKPRIGEMLVTDTF
jgi:hypothetical protein